MAERVEAEIPGIGRVEIKNAAQDATMRAILDVLEKANNVKSTNTRRQQTETDKNTRAQKNQSEAVRKSTETIEELDAQYEDSRITLSKFKSGITDSLDATKGATQELASTALQGSESLDAITTISDLVVDRFTNLIEAAGKAAGGISILGTNISGVTQGAASAASGLVTFAAGVSGFLIAQAEDLSNTFNDISQVGADFGGQLTQVKQTSIDLGVTLDDFSRIVQRSAEDFATIGGTVSDGIKIIGQVSQGVTDGQRRQLRQLGFTNEQIISGITEFTRANTLGIQRQNINVNQLSQGSFEYLKNLKLLASLTGEDVDQLKQRQRQFKMEGAVSASLFQLRQSGVQNLDQNLDLVTGLFGDINPALNTVIKEILATGGIASREANMIASQFPEVAGVIEQAVLGIRQGVDPRQLERNISQSLDVLGPAINRSQNEAADLARLSLFTQNSFVTLASETFPILQTRLEAFSGGLDAARKNIEDATLRPDQLNKDIVEARQSILELNLAIQQLSTNNLSLLEGPLALTDFTVDILKSSIDTLNSTIEGLKLIASGDVSEGMERLGYLEQEVSDAEIRINNANITLTPREYDFLVKNSGSPVDPAQPNTPTAEEVVIQRKLETIERIEERRDRVQDSQDYMMSDGKIDGFERRLYSQNQQTIASQNEMIAELRQAVAQLRQISASARKQNQQ